MAPNIDREAEHIKEKARKDLLALLENVRASDNACPISTSMLMLSGSWQEERGLQPGTAGGHWSLCRLLDAERIWC